MPFKTIKGKKVNIDESGIPPKHILDGDRLTKHDGRFFLVQETFPNAIAVDEYTKRAKDLFELKRNIVFTQDFEGSKELFETIGGGKDDEIEDEKEILEGLDSAGALQESNFGE